jgi:hypothetical protein
MPDFATGSKARAEKYARVVPADDCIGGRDVRANHKEVSKRQINSIGIGFARCRFRCPALDYWLMDKSAGGQSTSLQ